MRLIRRIYMAALLLLLGFVLHAILGQSWLKTDLADLLPHSEQNAILRAADSSVQKQMNEQVVLLAGNHDAEQAFQAAAEIATFWRQSGIFIAVEDRILPDLVQVRSDVSKLALAVLPETQRQQLLNEPQTYFRQRAEDAVNPFSVSPLSLEQDWLGLGRFVLAQSNPHNRVQWHAENGMVFSQDETGKTWVWIHGKLPETNRQPEQLWHLMQKSHDLAMGKADILTAGGTLFAAEAKISAERESQMMGTLGLFLTFAVLLWVFRSGRVFLLLIPLMAGMLWGLAASLWVFGEIHALTLVIGTSLVGMLVDFPLHWLTPAVFRQPEHLKNGIWQAQYAMREVLPTFMVSLLITASGYALLWFTPLPVLRQTAVFSSFALIGAFGATVLCLPPLFARYHVCVVPFTAWAEKWLSLMSCFKVRLRKPAWWFIGAVFLLGGWWQSHWKDDIRQWANLSPVLVQQAQQIAKLGGTELGGHYWVVEADSPDALLHKNTEVRRVLHSLIRAGKLGGMQSLDQFVATQSEQQKLQNRLRELVRLPETWQALADMGVPRTTIQQALHDAAAAPTLSLSGSLQTQLAQAWQPLYLGEVEQGRFAAIIRLYDVQDVAAVRAAVQHIQGVHWGDQRGALNEAFQHTRNQAAWLKLASFALAWLVLAKWLGWRRGSGILLVPLLAVATTISVLAWLGIPIGLFVMFGLLLVSAVGVDYALYAQNAPHTAKARAGGLILAALTTGISFALLSVSATPAVAAFGITVATGVILNLCLASVMLPEKQHCETPFEQPSKNLSGSHNHA
ncbi:MAG: hypothetical protein Q4B82_06010 [Alysiella sp.]|uniref:MMPL family transporter n=1 Tax=Alysiella sp. TaxID=1872483 RepID=UPI0026DD7C8B|nr:MMPL family transporter [Alysiella sp.]MDO4434117.1 hypothetical protein [Alysiella sp.]